MNFIVILQNYIYHKIIYVNMYIYMYILNLPFMREFITKLKHSTIIYKS